MNDLDLNQLDPRQLEVLTYHLAIAMGYDHVREASGTNDRGRDVEAYLPATIPGIRPLTRKVVFQCKRYKKIEPHHIEKDLAKCVDEAFDMWILVTTARPSRPLLDWLERVNQTGRYAFNIEAWWLNDLEKHVRENVDALLKQLPSAIINKIGLADLLRNRDAISLAHVSATFHALSRVRRDQYAADKYIPGVYVGRSIENVLETLRYEKAVAHPLRTGLIAQIEEVLGEIEEYLRHFDNIIANHPLTTKLASFLGLSSIDADKLRHLRRVRSGSIGFINDFQAALKESKSATERLSSEEYFNRRADYDVLKAALERTDNLISTMPLLLPSGRPLGSSEHYSYQPRIGIFSLNNFDEWIRSSILQMQTAIEEALRHATIIVEPAGSGKTNVFCHIADRLVPELPVLLFFGRQPVDGTNTIIKWVEDAMEAVGTSSASMTITDLDRQLERHGTFLLVLIDGINESRMFKDLGMAIERFLEWSSSHRIRVVLSCRDIYAEFFEFIQVSSYLQQPLRNQIGRFTESEYATVVSEYFKHFGIYCELGAAAAEACQHPLLLRFFCEAHRSPDRKPVFLGKIRDIRLKHLFGLYLNRKAEAIRLALHLYDPGSVEDFIGVIADEMLRQESSSLTLQQIESATGIRDTNTEQSLYVRVRDEHIIIAEEIGPDQKPRFSFSYEEFMEFMLARTLLGRVVAAEEQVEGEALFLKLKEIATRWANALGVGEFIALMLLEQQYGARRTAAIKFLDAFILAGERWQNVFWNVVGKCTEDVLGEDLFDLIHFAIYSGSNVRAIENSLALLSRCSAEACEQVSGVLLWSVAMPPVVRWTDLEVLRNGPTSGELNGLLNRITPSAISPPDYGMSADLSYGLMLDRVAPYLPASKRDRLNAMLKYPDQPQRGLVPREAMLVLLKQLFPEYRPLLLNGLFVGDRAVRRHCAFALRETTFARGAVAEAIRVIAERENDENIRSVLYQSADVLRSGRTFRPAR